MSRAMDPATFLAYYSGELCVCGEDKPENSAMCGQCRDTIQATNPALLHEIDNGDGEPLLISMGNFAGLVRKHSEDE